MTTDEFMELMDELNIPQENIHIYKVDDIANYEEADLNEEHEVTGDYLN